MVLVFTPKGLYLKAQGQRSATLGNQYGHGNAYGTQGGVCSFPGWRTLVTQGGARCRVLTLGFEI